MFVLDSNKEQLFYLYSGIETLASAHICSYKVISLIFNIYFTSITEIHAEIDAHWTQTHTDLQIHTYVFSFKCKHIETAYKGSIIYIYIYIYIYI